MLLRRFISTTPIRFNGPSSFLPLISSNFTSRLLGKETFETSVDEDTILETLRSIAVKPIPKSDFPVWIFRAFPSKNQLPEVPKTSGKEELIAYFDTLTSHKYPPKLTAPVREAVLSIVEKIPADLGKEDYLKVCFILHFFSRFKELFQVINTMQEHTSFKQDIDFENILLSETLTFHSFKGIVEKMDYLSDRNYSANANTFYYLFGALRNKEPKVQLIQMMQEFEIPLRPIFTMMKSLTSSFSPEQMNNMYAQEGLYMDEGNMESQEFNLLVSCYLENGRANEIIKLIESTPKCQKFITHQLFITFAQHFLKNNQPAYAIALSNYYTHKYKLVTRFQLYSILVNVFLRNPPYFENWLTTVQMVLYKVKKMNMKIGPKIYSDLTDYASLHHFDDNFYDYGNKAAKLSKTISNSLIWKNGPILELEKNSKQFIAAAKAVGHSGK